MYTLEKTEKLALPVSIISKYGISKFAFFDIETMGFNKANDSVILISIGYLEDNENFKIKQYFAESLKDEVNVLKEFSSEISKFETWCSYNGKAFDEPFIKVRSEKNNIQFTPPKYHFDLYLKIKPYHKVIGLERCNLKTVEKFLGLVRKDDIDGGESVELYKQYLLYGNKNIKEKILLHNYEDVLNLPHIFKLLEKMDETNVKSSLITEKQCGYIKFLLSKNKISLNYDFTMISKKAASYIINKLLSGSVDEDNINSIIEEARG